MSETNTNDAPVGLGARMDAIFKDLNRPLCAAEMADELNKRGWLPELCTTIDVADAMRERYG